MNSGAQGFTPRRSSKMKRMSVNPPGFILALNSLITSLKFCNSDRRSTQAFRPGDKIGRPLLRRCTSDGQLATARDWSTRHSCLSRRQPGNSQNFIIYSEAHPYTTDIMYYPCMCAHTCVYVLYPISRVLHTSCSFL